MRVGIKIVLLVLFFSVALFARDVATVTALRGDAYLLRDSVKIGVKLGDKLRENDFVITGSSSKVQIVFEDETVVSIGKNSKFSVNEYLFEDGGKVVAKFSILKGAMRTITGKIGKLAPERFSVKTKTATIGIRGTNFTVAYNDSGATDVYCTYGAIGVEVNGVEHLVKNGYYIHIPLVGDGNVKAFSAEDLKKMKEKNFNKSGESKAGSNLDEDDALASSNSQQTDTTREDSDSVVAINDIADNLRDAEHTSGDSSLTQQHDVMSGYIVGESLLDINHFVQLSMLDATTGNIKSGDSYIILSNAESATGSLCSWKIDFAQTPISYVSKEKFELGFSGASMIGDDSYVSNIVIGEYSSFMATGDDLADDDYMSWGTWNVSLEYDYIDTNGETQRGYDQLNGLWIAGEKTDAGVLRSMSGELHYDGIFKAIEVSNGGNIVEGSASMSVDFGHDSAVLNINYQDGRTFDMSIDRNNNYMSGSLNSQNPDASGYANGSFYGPGASEVGGNFNTVYGGSDELNGIYQLQVVTQ